MNWLKRLFEPRRRLAGAMVLATTVALAGSLFAAPASASANENSNFTVRRVNLDGGRGALVFRTSDGGGVLRDLRFEHGGRSVLLHSGVLRGTHLGGLGWRFALPATTWGLLNPYLGTPFGYPLGHGLGPMVVTTGFAHPGLFVGSLRHGDREWLRFRGD
jgi:hypothetical protein